MYIIISNNIKLGRKKINGEGKVREIFRHQKDELNLNTKITTI